MYACHSGSKHLVDLFLEFGGNIYAKSKNGVTALHLACAAGHLHIAEFLIDNFEFDP